MRPLAPPADPHNLPCLSAKGLTHANSEGSHSPPPSLPSPTHASLPVGQGHWPPEKLGCPSAPARARRAEQVTDCGHGEQRSAGRGWAQRRWAEGRRREGAARGEAGEARGSGRGWGPEASRLRGGAGTCKSRGPETRPAASVQIKAFRSKRARPCPSSAPYRSAPNGGLRELNENFRFLLQPLEWGARGGGGGVSGLK